MLGAEIGLSCWTSVVRTAGIELDDLGLRELAATAANEIGLDGT